MSWDRPLMLIAAAALPVIVLLHLLARRRRIVTVPSLYLWQRLLENEKRSMRLRRITADLLLVLQLTSAALAVLSLAGPRPSASAPRVTGPAVLALDVSAGMAAVDDRGRSRLEDALVEAEALVKGKTAGAEIAILSGAASVRSVTGYTRSRRDLLEALRNVAGTDEAGDIRTLHRAAAAMASARPGGRVFIITDGAFDAPPDVGAGAGIIRVGAAAENAGFSVFAVRPRPGGGREVLLVMENFGTQPIRRLLSVSLEDREWPEEELTMAPGERVVRSLAWTEALSGRLTARLRPGGGKGPEDALASDDGVYAVIRPEPGIRVRLYTPGNWFLETLLAAHPNVELDLRLGEDEANRPGGSVDLEVMDRLAPRDPAGGPVLAVYPFDGAVPALPLAPGPPAEGADPVNWDAGHPVMRDVDLESISVRRYAGGITDPTVRVLAESRAGPLIVCGDDGMRRWTALNFNLLDSSLPLSPAFPILMSNIMEWTLRRDPDSAAAMRRAGEDWVLPEGFDAAEGTVRDPDGESPDPDPGGTGTAFLLRPDRVGFWTIRDGNGTEGMGVNLLDAGESNLMPRWNPAADDDAARDAGTGAAGSSLPQDEPGRLPPSPTRPLTSVLLLAALAALLAEWRVQTRLWRRG